MFSLADPLENLTITGEVWLKQEDVLELIIKCTGSPPFQYCIKVIDGNYNMTGNETCSEWNHTDVCDFPFSHLFLDVQPHTVLLVIKNQVTVQRKIAAINIYDEKKQSQLSVFVVPVLFILVAIISVIFGVAKYVQTRNR